MTRNQYLQKKKLLKRGRIFEHKQETKEDLSNYNKKYYKENALKIKQRNALKWTQKKYH